MHVPMHDTVANGRTMRDRMGEESAPTRTQHTHRLVYIKVNERRETFVFDVSISNDR